MKGDALTLMGSVPSESVDLVLTDPPYPIFQAIYEIEIEKAPDA